MPYYRLLIPSMICFEIFLLISCRQLYQLIYFLYSSVIAGSLYFVSVVLKNVAVLKCHLHVTKIGMSFFFRCAGTCRNTHLYKVIFLYIATFFPSPILSQRTCFFSLSLVVVKSTETDIIVILRKQTIKRCQVVFSSL